MTGIGFISKIVNKTYLLDIYIENTGNNQLFLVCKCLRKIFYNYDNKLSFHFSMINSPYIDIFVIKELYQISGVNVDLSLRKIKTESK